MSLYAIINLLTMPVWIFLVYDAVVDLSDYEKRSWRAWTRLVIGLLGFITALILLIFNPQRILV